MSAAEGSATVVVGRPGPLGAPGRGACALGGPTRIIAPIVGADARALASEIAVLRGVAGEPVDLVEWRVDPLLAALPKGADADAVLEAAWSAAVSTAPRPVLASIRTIDEGGAANLSASEYSSLVRLLAGLADAVDVEIDRAGANELIADARAFGAVVVASHHDFSETPSTEGILEVFARMDAAGADVLKIACRANGPDDALRLLGAQVRARAEFSRPIIAIGMGGAGALTRLAGSLMGSAATFASVGTASAPGQFTAAQTRAVLDLVERGGAQSQ
ncbi:type I 3-dehydroquinate dehydratase [Actinomyces culturomici]|uniref:type I 3-dehydroquinate dehydratase n=1 Tax=Actinomyces culturomici TaxID=1926276 RepID=UPI000E20BEAF|nr:type I 3-dehydroquinate dehydratase [Actinomyces culturomici]